MDCRVKRRFYRQVAISSYIKVLGSANSYQTFALWELVYISQRFESRRQSIFADIDRNDGPVWTQVLSVCMAKIYGITDRIAEFQNPSLRDRPPLHPDSLLSLPRLSTPLRQDHILNNPIPPTSRREKIESNIGSIAKSYGQSPPSQQLSPLTPRAKQYLGVARKKLLTQGQQQTLNPNNVRASFNDYLIRFLRSPLGFPFRQTFKRRVRTVALGSPYSEFVQIVDAVDAISRLVVASLKEDHYGKVSKDVALILRTYANTIIRLEGFVGTMAVHWTDVEFQDRKVEEVDVVLSCLKEGLGAMIKGFGGYGSELGISEQEMRTMRMTAEMKEGNIAIDE